MMKIILLSLMMTPVLLWSQTAKETSAPETVTKIVRVHNARPEKLAELAGGSASAVSIRANDALKAIVVRGKAADVATVEQTIRELDSSSTPAASRDVELMVYLVSGSNAAPTASTPAEKLAALAPVVKQLRAIFPYSDYQLLSSMLLRSGEGSVTSSTGLLKPFQNGNSGSSYPSTYSITFKDATISQEGGRSSIHLGQFHFRTRPVMTSGTQTQGYEIGIQTDVDLPEGQKVVVGKANIETADSAIFVILSAKLMQ
ncbi:MAG TPA: secretin N-terminal domain-containing protein [Bryobacteraceae bacterium]